MGPPLALVLAAGLGTRMRSRHAKVLHPVLGWPMVRHAVAACQEAGLEVRLVVHHQEPQVREALAGLHVAFSRQEHPRGTGDAVRAALADLPATGTLVVLPGDAPLLRAQTLTALLDAHQGRLVTCLSVRLPDPAEYGRIVRDGDQLRIVEAAELVLAGRSEAERAAMDEVNSGVYAFDLAFLHELLPSLQPHPPKGELYLTDALAAASARGGAAVLCHSGDPAEVMGVNDRWAMSEAERRLGERLKQAHALAGVSFQDPASTRVEVEVLLGQDVLIGPGCVLARGVVLGEGVEVGPHCVLSRCRVHAGARILAHSVVDGAEVGAGAQVGPLARLRPGAVLEADVRVGNFVEVKQSRIEEGAKVSHLSYIGDARVGAGANVGAGTITCNYDGFGKHHTEIGAGAFIGSNTALVAPLRVGVGAIVGAGSTLTADVPDQALAVARGAQINRSDLAPRLRARNQALARLHAARSSGEGEPS